jgi:SAM-dependent methyltransferase
MTGSIAFDRAAEYYDETRGLSEDGVRRSTEALSHEFGSAGPILEVGVGTGQVAIPLAAAGVEVLGLDLSRPMLSKLVGKAGGAPPFPLVEGDATRMPFADDAFGGAYLRWVLHLIPDWKAAVAEIARVVEPGGRFLAALGSYGGKQSEIQARFAKVTGVSTQPVGLTWDGWRQLDDEMEAFGARKEADIRLYERDRDHLETFMQAIEADRFSWTWAVTDDAVRADAAREVRSWAEERWGPLEQVPRETFEWTFAAYRLG